MTIRHRVLSFSSGAAAVEANFEKVMAQGPDPQEKHRLRRLAKTVPQLRERARIRLVENSEKDSGGGTRTPDPTVNSRLLYQLSYSGSSPAV